METCERADCTRCTHFSIVWGDHNGRACAAYGFRSAGYPSLVVAETTGSPCQLFALKEHLARASQERPNVNG